MKVSKVIQMKANTYQEVARHCYDKHHFDLAEHFIVESQHMSFKLEEYHKLRTQFIEETSITILLFLMVSSVCVVGFLDVVSPIITISCNVVLGWMTGKFLFDANESRKDLKNFINSL